MDADDTRDGDCEIALDTVEGRLELTIDLRLAGNDSQIDGVDDPAVPHWPGGKLRADLVRAVHNDERLDASCDFGFPSGPRDQGQFLVSERDIRNTEGETTGFL